MFEQIQKAKKGTVHVLHFDCPFDADSVCQDFWPYSKRKERTEDNQRRFKSTRENFSERWSGLSSRKELSERLESGWPEGAARITELAASDTDVRITRRRRRVCLSDQGDELRIERVYSGDIDTAWSASQSKAKAGMGVLTIAANLAISSNMHSECLFWRGASVLRLADLLQEKGHSIGIVAFSYCADVAEKQGKQGPLDVCVSVDLKAPESPLDVSGLASTLAVAGFFRNVIMPYTAALADRHDRTVKWSFGYPDTAGRKFLQNALPFLPVSQSAIIQPFEVQDKASAEQWIEEVLANLSQEQATA